MIGKIQACEMAKASRMLLEDFDCPIFVELEKTYNEKIEENIVDDIMNDKKK